MITEKTILKKLGLNIRNDEYANAYDCLVSVFPMVTEDNIKEYKTKILAYLKMCHENGMSYVLIDKILSDKIGDFVFLRLWTWEEPHRLGITREDHKYIEINEDGSINIWCRPFGDAAYLHEYKKKWFTEKELPMLEGIAENINEQIKLHKKEKTK